MPRSVFVAPTAVVVGDVVLGEDTSVWYGCVIRGDVGPIRVGRRLSGESKDRRQVRQETP